MTDAKRIRRPANNTYPELNKALLVELAEQQAPELAGWVTAEAEQFLAALPATEPEESDIFIAELRSELPGEWADRAEAIYRRHLND